MVDTNNKKKSTKKFINILTLFVIVSIINLPIISALQFSEIVATDITDSTATISWTTDEEADSTVYYGTVKENLSSSSSGSLDVTDHEIEISGLDESTSYYYYVESNGEVDNNSESYYDFTTEAAPVSNETVNETISDEGSSSSIDTTVEYDEVVAGDKFDFTGTTTPGSEVRVYINEGYFSKKTATADGNFYFTDVPLEEDQSNALYLLVTSPEGVEDIFAAEVYSDSTLPKLTLNDYSSATEEDSLELSGSVSEEATVDIFVGEESVYSEVGTAFSTSINLEEGDNEVLVRATDAAGWTDELELAIISDTEPPEVDAEFEKGTEYYQNRAETDIFGTTEPGAEVYLYVYRPLTTSEYTPEFDEPWDMVTADEEGNFTFENVNFETEPITLQDFVAPEVPSTLLEVSIYPSTAVEQAQEFTYYVFIIAKDATGKTGYWREDVVVNTCYSPNFDFQVTDLAQFQQPLRLNPTLMDDGREVATAVFELEYRGSGSAQYDITSGDIETDAFQINSVQFEKACTQAMLEDEKTELGCKIMPSSFKVKSNGDETAHYVEFDLQSSESLSDRSDDYWNQFQKSQILFPLKISINYQEYDSQGNLGDSKTQTSCYDIGYFVDIPLESQDLIPDWLADEGTKSLNFTIDKIDKVLPYLEKAILVTGISCLVSTGVKTVVRFARIFSSKVEYLQDRFSDKKDDEKCPQNQSNLYLQDTVDNWNDLQGHKDLSDPDFALPPDYEAEENILDNRCPNTANLWKAEAAIDQAYRWTCDRYLCRAVPARWTENKDEEEIDTVIDQQRSCSATGSGEPLEKVENCNEFLKENPPIVGDVTTITEGEDIESSVCWHDADLNYYYLNQEESQDYVDNGVFKLNRVTSYLNDVGEYEDDIWVYQDPINRGTENGYIVAKDVSCQSYCERKAGYTSVSGQYKVVTNPSSGGVPIFEKGASDGACYQERDGYLYDIKGELLRGERYKAGYTKDCFVDVVNQNVDNRLYQCVCEKEDENAPSLYHSREAVKKVDDKMEIFSYRQDRIFKESGGSRGTKYLDERYYGGRDLSGAFGLNYLPDYINIANPKVHEVNPHSQYLSAWQTICLSGIYKQLVMIRSILEGLQKCIQEAKYTGFQDAGMCKTLFAQHVCGLIYKLISAVANRCVPNDFKDVDKENVGIKEVFTAGTESLYESLDLSIADLKDDYGNAVLNDYFAGGVQGFAESMCLAAFGFDWPMGFDFIMDAAYAVPMKTSALVVPATREFSNYDPQALTAVYNYEIGAVIFPGCKISSYRTYLACIGPNDRGHPGIDEDCGGAGCDCLNSDGKSAYETEKTYPLDGGYDSNVASGSMVDLPIESPQKVNKHFRYDHVVVEIQLEDPSEQNMEACFDSGYRDGKFYFPIQDVTPDNIVTCQVESTTGQFSCPELSSIFYDEGLAYLENPYVACYDKRASLEKGYDVWTDCDTPNLFLLDESDEILVKIYANTDGEGYCLDYDLSGSGTSDLVYTPKQIPSGIAGQIQPTISLGTVSSKMFGETENGLRKTSGSSGCKNTLEAQNSVSDVNNGEEIKFDYTYNGNTYRVKIESDSSVSVVSSGYKINSNGYLEDDSGNNDFSLDDVNAVVFKFEGIEFKGVIGSGSSADSKCVYETQSASTRSSSATQKSLQFKVKLLHPDSLGGCHSADEVVEATSALGKSSHTETIKIQKSSVVEAATSDIYTYYKAGDYNSVFRLAEDKITGGPATTTEAVGIFYYIAALIEKDGLTASENDIKSLLKRFFLREDSAGNVLSYFDYDDRKDSEFQKVRVYLCEIADKIGVKSDYMDDSDAQLVNCDISSTTSSSTSSLSLCGVDSNILLGTFSKPSDWTSYSCQASGTDCHSYSDYTSDVSKGCPGNEKCCK